MRALVRTEINAALAQLRAHGWSLPEAIEIPLDVPKRPEHGDLATNLAMNLARTAGRKPREIAEALVKALLPVMADASSAICSAEIAGPGFINLRVRDAAFQSVLATVFARGESFGSASERRPGRMLIEYVSANPTGPMHIGHARGAVVGDALVRVMRAAGYDVRTEYYVNDAGQKVVNLAWTVRAVLHGQELWSEAYRGAYLQSLARDIAKSHPDLVLDAVTFEGDGDARKPRPHASDRALAAVCVATMMANIRHTLDRLGLAFDVFASEQALVENGVVPALVDDWKARGLAEDRDGAVFFKVSETSEEDKDRVLRKSSGDFTYFATDIAYHRDKLQRGFTHLIDVWGADHHGYIARMRAALEALGLPKDAFEVLLMQMVALVKDGQPYRMSKSAGTFVAIDDVLDDIDHAAQHEGAGRDALRYFLLMRSSDSPMEIDVDLAARQSVENPVFYAQYTHARMCQILERARAAPEFELARTRGLLTLPSEFDAKLAARLTLSEEKDILALCDQFPALVHEAANNRAPHRVVFFAQQLAQAFASYYTRLQKVHADAILPQKAQRDAADWIDRWDWEKTRARLMWVAGVRQVYANALRLVGVDAPARMAKRALENETDGAATSDET